MEKVPRRSWLDGGLRWSRWDERPRGASWTENQEGASGTKGPEEPVGWRTKAEPVRRRTQGSQLDRDQGEPMGLKGRGDRGRGVPRWSHRFLNPLIRQIIRRPWSSWQDRMPRLV